VRSLQASAERLRLSNISGTGAIVTPESCSGNPCDSIEFSSFANQDTYEIRMRGIPKVWVFDNVRERQIPIPGSVISICFLIRNRVVLAHSVD